MTLTHNRRSAAEMVPHEAKALGSFPVESQAQVVVTMQIGEIPHRGDLQIFYATSIGATR
jgi:hypothetical protein